MINLHEDFKKTHKMQRNSMPWKFFLLSAESFGLLIYITVCPLVFPDAKSVARDCGNEISNRTACCMAMDNYVSHLQKQSFITNLQALDCASQLGRQLQEMNISANVYSLCQVTLKDFSLQGLGELDRI